jgi:hypothetical protein
MCAPRSSRPAALPLIPVAALLSTLSLATLPARAPAQILTQTVPSRFDLEVRPGQRESRPFILQNLGRESVKVRLSVSDFRMSERGALALLAPGTLEATLARRVELEPAELTLGPGQRGVVRLSVTLPANGPATRYGVVLSRVTPAETGVTTGVRPIPAELGTTIFVTRLPRSSVRADLVGLDARVGADGKVMVGVRVRNRSGRHAACAGDVKLSDSTGAVALSGALSDGIVLPGATRIFEWNGARRLAAGRYTVTATIDFGEPELLVGQKEIVVGARARKANRAPAVAGEAP